MPTKIKNLLLLSIFILFSTVNSQSESKLRQQRLEDVENWFYYLAFNIPQKDYQAMINSDYDMIVIEPVFTEKNNQDFNIEKFVSSLHDKKDRIVLAYIDIGQAEEWRSYWQPNWRLGNPEWIVSTDPDGWGGNYPLAFWNKDWQEIFLNQKSGYLQQMIDAGFDGFYLDWIEAFSEEAVIAQAIKDDVDAREEMIDWVGTIADWARANSPTQIIIAQNASELADSYRYRQIIDAIAQEQIWFDGSSDNNPPGDCPLPKTEKDIDSQEYFDSLTTKCRRIYSEFPESTLHTSSQEYIENLTYAQAHGITIFTVDYATEKENIEAAFKNSLELGFKPFVSNRLLNSFITLDR